MNYYALESSAFDGITSAITGGITDLLPVGIAILGAMLGVKLIPKVIHKFF